MEQIRNVYAAQMRPIVLRSQSGAESAGLEIVETNGGRFAIVLSGEGMQGLAEDIQEFLAGNPHLAEIKSQPRQ